ncbi:GNAT family N-acetyltransferase [Streptomyces pathocidini]|uniref:GNAT family N-acetyltransferase n=1 Tax=Streptomyces pathocidini TaxID=1650571 RepID=A0ABW7UQS8_9ACTN|nr:GNAT family N-acetyltransferase [Streptomyces pathocidini]
MQPALRTDRLLVRDWAVSDAREALAIYGAEEVAHWLTPDMHRVGDLAAMRHVLQAWEEAQPGLVPPSGRWAIERLEDGQLVGGLVIRMLPPYEEDLEIGWQLRPGAWGHGYATEAGAALTRWAFRQGVDELFAVARPNNHKAAATARRIGMEWVGETSKYYEMRLNVYRIRPSDLPDTTHA